MEKIKRISLVILAALLCIAVTACDPYGDYPTLIVGTWDNTDVPARTERYTFNADGSGSYAIIQGGKEVIKVEFEYSLEENRLTQLTADGTAEHSVKIDGNTLTLTQGKSTQTFTLI